uniref:glycerophosphodiester phosphodiesterase n=1 Tax=Aegilops tauschii subsp. strangulata TaxID=200361 RepID=A0A453RN98_AEGTS
RCSHSAAPPSTPPSPSSSSTSRVTKDGCPVIFHDDFILTQKTEVLYEMRVTDLLLEEFLSYGVQKEPHKVSKPLLRRMEDGRVLTWSTEEDDYLCTLQEVFEHVSPHLGFNIELKFDDNIIYPSVNLNRALQAVLQVWIALVHLIYGLLLFI